MIKLYLDNCCYNRPFDDQTQLAIQLETQAKFLRTVIEDISIVSPVEFVIEKEREQ